MLFLSARQSIFAVKTGGPLLFAANMLALVITSVKWFYRLIPGKNIYYGVGACLVSSVSKVALTDTGNRV